MRIALSTLEIVSFCDPASGRPSSTGKQKARTAIVTVGQAPEGHAFVLHEWADRVHTDLITEKIFMINSDFRPRQFGIESSAQQNLWVDSVIREASTRGKRIAIVPITQLTNQTKEFRITSTVQKWLHNGLLYISDTCPELKKEMEKYPEGQTCDIVDAMASALNMLRDPFASKRGLKYELSGSLESGPKTFDRFT